MLKKYEEKHRRICLKIFLDIFRSKPYSYDWIVDSKIERYFCDIEKSPKFFGFVYEIGGEIIGFCLGVVVDYFNNISYDIKEICVKRQIQGKGIGSQMLKDIEQCLSENGVEVITLATLKTLKAFEFYQKKDFKQSENAVYFMKRILR